MRFGLLGALTVHDADGRERALGAPKNRALLAVLLLRANRAVSLDTVKSALWGEHPPASATASVHNHVTRLRRALGEEGPARLRAEPPGYRIEAGEHEVDALVFTGLVAAADAARRRGDWATVGSRARAALALWRGDPLTGIALAEPAAARLEPELEQWRQSRLQALEWRLEADLRGGGHEALVAELTALTAEHPLREGFHRQLMLALHRSGRQAEALGVFQRLRRRLVAELGVEPGADARAAHREILAPPEADPAATFEASPTGASGTPAQLHRDVADFTGRRDQLERLAALLAPDRTPGPGTLRVVAVSGPGGIGKTTLAVRTAHRVADGFPDGQLHVDLRGVHHAPAEPGEVLAGFLRDLGTPEHEIPLTEDARAARYRSLLADRRVLVVLDNARDAAQVRPLLPGSAGCAALVTARRRLPGLAGAVHLDLTTLGDRDAHELFVTVAGRRRAAAEPEATAEVVRHCAGLPLALRIAAARLAGRPSWRVATLADRLADHTRRLDELRVEDLAVRASFLMSYAQLPSPEGPEDLAPARAFRLLGLAPGADIGLRAAAALLDRPPGHTEQVLEHLVDACLLDSTGPDRYQLHDLLRDFAAERAEAEESPEARREAVGRIVRWYLDSLVEADAALYPGRGRPERLPEDPSYRPHGFAGRTDALRWCDTERVNLVRATSAASAYGFHQVAWRIPGHGWSYFNLRSLWQDWLTTTEAGLDSARSAGDRAGESTMLTCRGAAFMQLGHWAQAQEHMEASLVIREETGEISGQMTTTNTLGIVLQIQNRHAEAREFFRRALRFAGPPELRKHETTVLNNLGRAELELGNHAEARQHLERSLELSEEFGDIAADAETMISLGVAHVRLGDPASAVPLIRSALDLAAAAGALFTGVVGHAQLAIALAGTGQREAAEEAYERAAAAAAGLSGAQVLTAGAVVDAAAAVLGRTPRPGAG
ncbi:AfsR/SARP family transcriptional regulator [Kitasatospora sp. NPDC088346]|uniref:AfsR/SARP family transcriptional regulator n=1 Tax=Kitasatospora sp. NPDC088346 TaxID=3364073 RepID=UPI0038162DA7